ncbi:hypothetical protein PUW24_18790 [Paenibacillus urinalis]|uniref:Urease accessory protein UreH-like transmembrane domain-containing protein n=1 Tax=Paenibacillus urinalis TaxID=521520 RepID=A0AAX3N7M0_9BACL|nr:MULTISPECIES: hypothetical protein [Paenibacillus]WDH84750.1 hypothetical protein PUW23_11270 [Paenibacillus urinalis]WDH96209.1 hypothetical protein PUW24_18790 [Paenibacillus urinalis]WDI04432.1 hypothetical protein PUW25_10955 [Paenibacillus urinalis]
MLIILFLFAIGSAIASVDTTCGLNVLGSLEHTKGSKMKYAFIYIISCMAGGTATGLIISGLNAVIGLTTLSAYSEPILITWFVIVLLLEMFNKSAILPSGNFIVPSSWISKADYRTAALWGNILGLGFITLQAGVLFHTYVFVSLFTTPWWASVAAGCAFGCIRGIVYSIPVVRSMVYRLLEKRAGHYTFLTATRLTLSYLLILGSIAALLIS